jgi:hypothetical protein
MIFHKMQDRFARHVLASRSLISAPLPLTRRILAAVMAHTARKGDEYFGSLEALDEKFLCWPPGSDVRLICSIHDTSYFDTFRILDTE